MGILDKDKFQRDWSITSDMAAYKRSMMHKYWGKKPFEEIAAVVRKYSTVGDTLLDPFAGYGGFASEALIADRKVIANDLNPMSCFITQCLVSANIDMKKMRDYAALVLAQCEDSRAQWYSFADGEIVATLRDHDGVPLCVKIKRRNSRGMEERDLSKAQSKAMLDWESNAEISDWYPTDTLIPNSRISVGRGETVDLLFDKRSLACHAKLLSAIHSLPDGNERNLLLLAFTSNLANCSKLVPPIRSRGRMAPGAWMTGFYIGETYIENNVFHYFENRLQKVIAGKEEYLSLIGSTDVDRQCSIICGDACALPVDNDSVDLVFTDFPYGDTVPYLEQSALWNAWMKFRVDYDKEIVISNSSERAKTRDDFARRIDASIREIYRVLKMGKVFVFTYHSLSGAEWAAITNSLLGNGFEVIDLQLLTQKTLPPRQLNRNNTVKGDLLITCRKTNVSAHNDRDTSLSQDCEFREIFRRLIKENHLYETNDIIVEFLRQIFRRKYTFNDENIFSSLHEVAQYDGKGWIIQ